MQDDATKALFLKHKHAVEHLVSLLDSPREVIVIRACSVMQKIYTGHGTFFDNDNLM